MKTYFTIYRYGETALHLATRAGYCSVVNKLIEEKADVNIEGAHGSPFAVAKTSKPEMLQLYESKF